MHSCRVHFLSTGSGTKCFKRRTKKNDKSQQAQSMLMCSEFGAK